MKFRSRKVTNLERNKQSSGDHMLRLLEINDNNMDYQFSSPYNLLKKSSIYQPKLLHIQNAERKNSIIAKKSTVRCGLRYQRYMPDG